MKLSLKIAALLVLVVAVCAKPSASTNRCHGKKDGTKLPNMTDCHKYIKCENEKEKSKSCSSEKDFDAVSLSCVKTSEAVCFEATPVTTTTTTKKPTTTTTTTTKKTTTKKPTTTTTEIPIVEDPIPECFSVNESDCGMYYDCNGEAHWEKCLEGYIYFAKLRSCLPGNAATCELYTLN